MLVGEKLVIVNGLYLVQGLIEGGQWFPLHMTKSDCQVPWVIWGRASLRSVIKDSDKNSSSE